MAVVALPGFCSLAVENSTAGDSEIGDVIDSDPFSGFIRQIVDIGIGLERAS